MIPNTLQNLSSSILRQALNKPSPQIFSIQKRYATKKMGASKARQKRSPEGKRLGLKKYEGEPVNIGNIIVKQRGTKNHPGQNVAIGRDHTIYALKPGFVHFSIFQATGRKLINVVENDPKIYEPKLELKYWSDDSVFQRLPNGERLFELIDLASLPPVQKHELSAVDFDHMQAHLKAMNLSDRLGSVDGYQFADRFKEARKASGRE